MIKCPRMIFSGVANKLFYLPFLFLWLKLTWRVSIIEAQPSPWDVCVCTIRKKSTKPNFRNMLRKLDLILTYFGSEMWVKKGQIL